MEKIVLSPDFSHLEAFLRSLPERFARGEGEVMHQGRNEVRRLRYEGRDYVAKSFCRPHLLNRLVYGTLRGSKACRSYRHALAFLRIGVGTPTPVGYMEVRTGLLLDRSYYVSLLSPCPYTYADLYADLHNGADGDVADAAARTDGNGADAVACADAAPSSLCLSSRAEVLTAIGRTTALIHRAGYLHRDYSRGNILFGTDADGRVSIQIVDLNRMLTHRRISLRLGCKNFERLPATPHMRHLMAQAYAQARGFDPTECERLMARYRRQQAERIPGVDIFPA